MSHTTTAVPTRIALGADRHRLLRFGAGAACVAALVAGGGYAATETFGPDAYQPVPVPSQQVLQQQQESLAAQYGTAPAAPVAGTIATNAQLRSIHESMAAQYGAAPVTVTSREPSVGQLRSIHENVAGQYGTAPATREPSDRQLGQIRDGLARVYGGAR